MALLGMLDAWPEENTSDELLHTLFIYERTLRALLRQDLPTQLAFLKDRTQKRLREALNHIFGDAPARADRIKASLWHARRFPGESFVPPKVSCRIDVFRTLHQPYWRVTDRELGWGSRTTGGVDVHYIDGDHDTFMREEHVGPLARYLRECLRNAEEERERVAAVNGRRTTLYPPAPRAQDGAQKDPLAGLPKWRPPTHVA
jgi:thioesterase domain-containing protein